MPKIVDHAQYRKELLSQCFGLFAEKGYASITMRQIAEGLGVSTGTLYHYFPSKKDLFEQLVDHLSQQDILTIAVELEGTQTLQERLDVLAGFLTKNEDYFLQQIHVWMDFCQHEDFKNMGDSPILHIADQRYQQAVSDFLGISDPLLIRFILSFIDGVILHRIFGYEGVSFSEQITLLGKMLIAYLEHPHNTEKEKI